MKTRRLGIPALLVFVLMCVAPVAAQSDRCNTSPNG